MSWLSIGEKISARPGGDRFTITSDPWNRWYAFESTEDTHNEGVELRKCIAIFESEEHAKFFLAHIRSQVVARTGAGEI